MEENKNIQPVEESTTKADAVDKNKETINEIIEETKKNPTLGFLRFALVLMFIAMGAISYLYLGQRSDSKSDKDKCASMEQMYIQQIKDIRVEQYSKDTAHKGEIDRLMTQYTTYIKDMGDKQGALNSKYVDLLINKK